MDYETARNEIHAVRGSFLARGYVPCGDCWPEIGAAGITLEEGFSRFVLGEPRLITEPYAPLWTVLVVRHLYLTRGVSIERVMAFLELLTGNEGIFQAFIKILGTPDNPDFLALQKFYETLA